WCNQASWKKFSIYCIALTIATSSHAFFSPTQFNLAGMRCSCGIFCVPAFKIPRQRVDESLEGGEADETLAAALAADARLGGAFGGGDGEYGGDDGEEGEGAEAARARRK